MTPSPYLTTEEAAAYLRYQRDGLRHPTTCTLAGFTCTLGVTARKIPHQH